MPENPRRIVAWMVAHYLFAPFLLISGIGLVWYVAPDYQKIYGDWIAFVAIGGIAGAIASIAIMRRAAAGTDAKQATARLLVIAAGAVVIGLLAWLATPSDWRVGVGSLAVFLLLANSAVERSERTGADPAG